MSNDLGPSSSPTGIPTRHEVPPLRTKTRHEGLGNEAGPRQRVNLPDALVDRFSFVKSLPSGGEADLLLVKDSTGAQFVAKIYRTGLVFDETALRLLGEAKLEHVVKILEQGVDESFGARWELQEWCRHGSLADVVKAGVVVNLNDLVWCTPLIPELV
jgi:hypothetical protein